MAPLQVKRNCSAFTTILICQALAWPAAAQIILSGNENKIDLTSGGPKVVARAEPDSISILDFSVFPPSVRHVTEVPNSVIGLALIANSIQLDPRDSTKWVPESFVHLLDLKTDPPKVLGKVKTGGQPSGISITPDGRLALVANRADGSVSVLSIRSLEVSLIQTVQVCEPAESVSDVAIAPEGKLALASVQKGSYLAVLRIEGDRVIADGRKLPTCGQPYRVVITPDGELGLTAGQGYGNGLDRDAVTVIDLKSNPMRTTDYIAVGAVPESIEISPDGKLLAVVLMNGSNLAPGDPNRTRHGGLVLLERNRRTFRVVAEHSIGRIPEGVAFTSDGKYLVVQCHPDRELWIFSVKRGALRDTGQRIKVPGMPSSLRAAR
jgi:DNA-binding beta-propeller fold protein YncE